MSHVRALHRPAGSQRGCKTSPSRSGTLSSSRQKPCRSSGSAGRPARLAATSATQGAGRASSCAGMTTSRRCEARCFTSWHTRSTGSTTSSAPSARVSHGARRMATARSSSGTSRGSSIAISPEPIPGGASPVASAASGFLRVPRGTRRSTVLVLGSRVRFRKSLVATRSLLMMGPSRPTLMFARLTGRPPAPHRSHSAGGSPTELRGALGG